MEGKEKKEEKRSQREDDARVEGKARSLESEGGAKAGQPGRPPNFSWARPQSCKGPRWPRAPCDFASLQDVDCDIGGGWPSPALAINRGRKHSPRTLPLGPARKPPCLKRIF